MLEAPLTENLEDFRLRIDNHLENNTDLQETATSLHSIEQSFLMEGNLEQSESYFQKAVELYRNIPDEFSLAFCLSQYALILRHLSKSKTAEELLVEVVGLSKNLGLKRKDIKNWFLKPYFYVLLKHFNEPVKAIALRKKT